MCLYIFVGLRNCEGSNGSVGNPARFQLYGSFVLVASCYAGLNGRVFENRAGKHVVDIEKAGSQIYISQFSRFAHVGVCWLLVGKWGGDRAMAGDIVSVVYRECVVSPGCCSIC